METMLRGEFEALSTKERFKAIKTHKIVDAPPKPNALDLVTDEAVLTRQEFEALSPKERFIEIQAGRRIVNGVRAMTKIAGSRVIPGG